MALWGGRFTEPTDDDLKALNDSIGFDKRMYRQDIAGSVAYARALVGAGVLTAIEAETIIDGLFTVRDEFEHGSFVLMPDDEDIHTAVERRLTELVGEVGGKLHTGRSRNDQVATDFRLWVMDAITHVNSQLKALQQAFVEKAEAHIDTLMPGYTHMQPAQPITAAHWLMSFFWMIGRDRERLQDTRRRTSVSPLGSGALAGHPFTINRDMLARDLGFNSYSQNSLDGVSDRDFVAETLFDLALMSTHLSRFAEDVIIYSNPSFGFVKLDDRYSTGSSLMPQKRNADPLELTRGKTGRLIGYVTAILTTLKGLPSTYNKDLQEDKEAIFDAVDNINRVLPVFTAIVRTLNLNVDKMRAALTEDMLATDLADFLVRKGMPFREAHHVSGRAVQLADEKGVTLSKLEFDDYRKLSALFDEDVLDIFDFTRSVTNRAADGGTAPSAVKKQIEAAKALLEQ